MEEKNEHVTGPMLIARHTSFEVNMNVPENECMTSDGWVWKFCTVTHKTIAMF